MEERKITTHKWVVFKDSVIDLMKIEAVTPSPYSQQGSYIHTRTQRYSVPLTVGEVLEIIQNHA